METNTATAQTYIVTVYADTVYRAFLFISLHNELELVDVYSAPGFVEQELFTESVRSRWYKEGAIELSVTNRKIFNLEAIKEEFPEHKSIVVDIGTQKSSVVSYKEGLFTIKEDELGTANGLLNALSTPMIRHTFADLIPFEEDKAEILDFLAEREFYPARYPANMRERVIDIFAARTLINSFSQKNPRMFSISRSLDKSLVADVHDTASLGTAVLTGEAYLEHFAHPLQSATGSISAFSFLDGASIRGIWTLFQDGQGILSSIGRLKKEGVEIGSLNKFITQLGTVVALEHSIEDGKNLGILRFDLGYQAAQEVHIKAGDIVRLPFEDTRVGSMMIELERDVDIYGLDDKNVDNIEIVGGPAGIIIDARRRTETMSIASNQQVKQWLKEVGLQDL